MDSRGTNNLNCLSLVNCEYLIFFTKYSVFSFQQGRKFDLEENKTNADITI